MCIGRHVNEIHILCKWHLRAHRRVHPKHNTHGWTQPLPHSFVLITKILSYAFALYWLCSGFYTQKSLPSWIVLQCCKRYRQLIALLAIYYKIVTHVKRKAHRVLWLRDQGFFDDINLYKHPNLSVSWGDSPDNGEGAVCRCLPRTKKTLLCQ